MEQNFDECKLNLELLHEKWENVYKYGDPCADTTDGYILSHIRSLINYNRKKLEMLGQFMNKDMPEIYNKELPREVAKNYMANSDEVYDKAISSYRQYQSSDEYCRLMFLMNGFTQELNREFYITDLYNVVINLNKAIISRDFGTMRKLSRTDKYLPAMDVAIKIAERYIKSYDTTLDADELYLLKGLFN